MNKLLLLTLICSCILYGSSNVSVKCNSVHIDEYQFEIPKEFKLLEFANNNKINIHFGYLENKNDSNDQINTIVPHAIIIISKNKNEPIDILTSKLDKISSKKIHHFNVDRYKNYNSIKYGYNEYIKELIKKNNILVIDFNKFYMIIKEVDDNLDKIYKMLYKALK